MSPARPEMETGVRVKAWAPAGGTTLSGGQGCVSPYTFRLSRVSVLSCWEVSVGLIQLFNQTLEFPFHLCIRAGVKLCTHPQGKAQALPFGFWCAGLVWFWWDISAFAKAVDAGA